MRRFPLLLSLLTIGPLQAQQPATPPAATAQLSPKAAYAEAMHPLEITRHNIANWSDTELAAMQVTITQAREGCLARQPDRFTGADLLDLARLCALGQQWAAVVTTASRYIAEPTHSPALLTDAYVAKTEALLRLQQEPQALETALTMLEAVPFSTDVSDTVDEAAIYMRYVHTADALKLLTARQPLLLKALKTPSEAQKSSTATPIPAPAPAQSPAQSPVPAAPALPAVPALYTAGLLKATLEQLAADPQAAAATVATLEAALPSTLSTDDTLLIARARTQYALLGKPVLDIHPLAALSMPFNMPPNLPIHGAITAMLLFPDWCAACVRLGTQLPPTVFTVEGHSAYLYALLAETVPQRQLPDDPDSSQKTAFSPAYAAAIMHGSATVTVPPALLQHYTADNYPLLLIADAAGVLRIATPLTDANLQPGGEVDAAIALVGRNFSPKPPPTTPPAPNATP